MSSNARRRTGAFLIAALLIVAGCSADAPSSDAANTDGSTDQDQPESAEVTTDTVIEPEVETETVPVVAELERGINFAGDFEVEPRGAWGQPILDEDFATAAEAGFDHIRLPIRWSSYTGAGPEFVLDPAFVADVDRVVDLALASDLTIVINVHHFEEIHVDPAGERGRYLAIWEQLSEHFAERPASVVFELLNEPVGVFDDEPELWNQLASDALEIVRRNNPTRTVIIGSVDYNHADRLVDLRLPDDPNLVATFHTYDPGSFTTQGAVFIDPIPPTGLTWNADHAWTGFDWREQSWDAEVVGGVDGISIGWARSFAGFAVAALEQPQSFDEVQIEVSESFEASVLCNFDTELQTIDVVWTGTTASVDVSACGPINTLALQHTGAAPEPTVLSRLALCSVTCEEIITSQWDALDAQISGAAAWAEEQDVPLYLGEFGVYDSPDEPVDPASRFAWTNAVRTLAEQNDMGWAYFAMSDEFGAYDRANERWRPEVLDALLS